MQSRPPGPSQAQKPDPLTSPPKQPKEAAPNKNRPITLLQKLASDQVAVQDDRARRQYLLQILIVGVGLLLLLTLPPALVTNLLPLDRLIIVLLGFVTLAICYFLNRAGRVRLAGYLFVILLVVLLLGRGFFVPLPVISELGCFFALTGLIIVAGLLLDEIAPFLVALGGTGIFLGYFLGQNRLGELSPPDRDVTVQAISFGIGIHFILAALAWGNSRTMRRLVRNLAWQNEKLLEFNQQIGRSLEVSNTAGNTISDIASELNSISYDQTERAESQVQSVSMVSATLQELSMTARQIADVAESVFSATEEALKTAESGGQAVGESISGIDTLRQNVDGVVAIVSDLSLQSNRIGEIVELITELAEETNLLALNATIEAAGAGEYGRRFAVIAAEVQDLSIRSRGSARDVQQILSQIKNSIARTLLATERGLDEARRVTQIAEGAGEAIEQIIETVESTNHLARQIHLTTQQQRSATDQAVDMVRQLAGDARDAAGGAQHVLKVSNQLNDTALNLRQD